MTNGPDETPFLKYYNEQNLLRTSWEEETVQLKRLDLDGLAEPVAAQAERVLQWGRTMLEDSEDDEEKEFSYGDYRFN